MTVRVIIKMVNKRFSKTAIFIFLEVIIKSLVVSAFLFIMVGLMSERYYAYYLAAIAVLACGAISIRTYSFRSRFYDLGKKLVERENKRKHKVIEQLSGSKVTFEWSSAFKVLCIGLPMLMILFTLFDISPQENAPFDHYFEIIQKGARAIGIVIFWLVFGFLLLIKPHAGTPSWMRKKK